MSVHVFQISALNGALFTSFSNAPAGAYTSDYAQQPDNVNGNLSRYYGIYGVWADVTVSGGLQASNSNAGSYGMPTGVNNSTGDGSAAWRPHGGYFLRGVWFADNSIPPSTTGFRDGYYGSFQSGMINFDYAHDPTTLSVDYEPLYGHGVGRGWPEAVYTNAPNALPTGKAAQFLDSGNLTADTGLVVTNSGSAYTRTPYMPPDYFRLYCANNPAGSASLSSGNVKFFFEARPTLNAAGYNDANQRQDGGGNNTPAGSFTFETNQAMPYTSDPQRGYGNPLRNPCEVFQITGVRKLNSRSLSMIFAKVFDNSFYAYSYLYEEDGQTLQPNLPVNVQQEYLWQRGLEFFVTATQVTSNVATFTCSNSLVAGQQVILQGFVSHPEFNGQVVTVLASGLSGLQFEANWTHGNYGPSSEGTAVASYGNDIRIRQAATFTINEEYYGFAMDTKCCIFSNKSSMIPLLFFDLVDTWGASVAPRIAGVTVTGVSQNPITSVQIASNVATVTANNNYKAGDQAYVQNLGFATFLNGQTLTVLTSNPQSFTASFTHGNYGPTAEITGTAGGYKVWFLSEDGFLAVYDFTQLNGAVSLLGPTAGVAPNAPSPATGYCYGALKHSADQGTIYAVYGHVAQDPRLATTSASSPQVGVISYSVSGQTWGSPSYIPNPARHNGRSLDEMIVLRDGRIAIMCEEVSYVGTTVTNYLMGTGTPPVYLNIQWQVAVLDPAGPTWSSTIVDGNTAPPPSPLFATLTNVSSSGGVLTYTTNTMTTPFPVGAVITLNQTNLNNSVLNGQLMTVLASPAPTTTSFSVNVPNNYTTSPTTQTEQGNASMGLQYGIEFGLSGNNHLGVPYGDYWFYKPNAFLHDVGINTLLVQGSWTAGALWVLNTTPPTASISNADLAPIQAADLWSYNQGGVYGGTDPFVLNGYSVSPGTCPVSITHARDFATNADRVTFLLHNILGQINSALVPIYLAPPGFNWTAVGANYLDLIQNSNEVLGGGDFTNYFKQDYWNIQYLASPVGDARTWTFPVMLLDNYHTFVQVSGSDVYGICGQSTGFLPTYFKWNGSTEAITQVAVASNIVTVTATNTFTPGQRVTIFGLGTATFLNGVTLTVLTGGGSNFTAKYTYPNYGPAGDTGTAQIQWVMADRFADAFSNPYTIPGGSFSTPIPLPYGLEVAFGPSGSDSWTSAANSGPFTASSEFFTFNVAWGNTKFARKSRNTWAMFAGQTFLFENEAHTVAQESALSFQFWDTDTSTVTFTAPTNVVGGASATLSTCFSNTNSQLQGWNTCATWPKLDVSHNAFDATPLVMNIHANNFNPGSLVYAPPQLGPTGSGTVGSPYAWTQTGGPFNGVSYAAYSGSAGGGFPNGPTWYAFAGRPDIFWGGNGGQNDEITINLGAPQTITGYSFRPLYSQFSFVPTGCPTSWTIQGSATGAFAGEQVTIDTQSGFSAFARGLAFNAATPGSYQYVRMSITATNDGQSPNVGMLQYFSTARQGTFNFQDVVLFSYGNQINGGPANAPQYLATANLVRGLSFAVSVNNGTSYTPITPLWRAHLGYVFSFPRQTGITDLKITIQQGFNCNNNQSFETNGTNAVSNLAASGPFYLVDYGVDPTTNGSRLGSSTAADATPPRGSYDTQCIGVAGDAMSISLDGGSPSAFMPMYNVPTGGGGTVGNYGPYHQLLGFWDMAAVPPFNGSSYYKAHPFFGFLFFFGAGTTNGYSGQTGTNLDLTYNWGRRV